MEKSTYDAMIGWLERRPKLARGISLANKAITYAVYVAYPGLLIWLLHTRDTFVLRAVLVPLISFVAVTVARKLVNAPRPYEVFGRKPIISKKTKGKSMPSRHVFSITVIAMTYMAALPTPIVGIVMMAIGVVLAAVRVLTGVHFVKDVVCGMLVGIACGIVGFYIV